MSVCPCPSVSPPVHVSPSPCLCASLSTSLFSISLLYVFSVTLSLSPSSPLSSSAAPHPPTSLTCVPSQPKLPAATHWPSHSGHRWLLSLSWLWPQAQRRRLIRPAVGVGAHQGNRRLVPSVQPGSCPHLPPPPQPTLTGSSRRLPSICLGLRKGLGGLSEGIPFCSWGN